MVQSLASLLLLSFILCSEVILWFRHVLVTLLLLCLALSLCLAIILIYSLLCLSTATCRTTSLLYLSLFPVYFPFQFTTMGHFSNCIKTQVAFHVLLSMLLLLSSTQVVYSAGGRSLSNILELAKDRGDKIAARALIGSRPPRCEGRCISCGHCEAVQVPIVPQLRIDTKHIFAALAYRVDDHSNYKPLSWKCKCGNSIFDP